MQVARRQRRRGPEGQGRATADPAFPGRASATTIPGRYRRLDAGDARRRAGPESLPRPRQCRRGAGNHTAPRPGGPPSPHPFRFRRAVAALQAIRRFIALASAALLPAHHPKAPIHRRILRSPPSGARGLVGGPPGIRGNVAFSFDQLGAAWLSDLGTGVAANAGVAAFADRLQPEAGDRRRSTTCSRGGTGIDRLLGTEGLDAR